ncbi:MAG TPA: hypothetical protein EYH39_04685 [Desulfurobacteriaceae bacterium]|nr:hypothetical protein [Desulfurobacteriaceae bacterium]
MNKIVENLLSLGVPKDIFQNPSLIIEGSKIIKEVPHPGILIEKQPKGDKLFVKITVMDNVKVDEDVHLCLSKIGKGSQEIFIDILAGKNSKVKFVSHCAFKGKDIKHITRTNFKTKENSFLEVEEVHYHDKDLDILIDTKTKGVVGNRSTYKSLFKIDRNNAGKVQVVYEVDVLDYGSVDVETKIAGRDGDDIFVKDIIYLKGNHSKALSKSRIVALGKMKAEFYGETYGLGDYSRGHIDCSEIIRNKDVVLKAIPVVVVNNPTAKVTHEAAIGSLDKKQIQTLMLKGYDEDEAVEIIVRGLLR